MWLWNLWVTIVAHMLFTKLMDALFSSYTNLGTKMPKNDATITRKKTTHLLRFKMHNYLPKMSQDKRTSRQVIDILSVISIYSLEILTKDRNKSMMIWKCTHFHWLIELGPKYRFELDLRIDLWTVNHRYPKLYRTYGRLFGLVGDLACLVPRHYCKIPRIDFLKS